jgi:long-subunit fatty acid transport protein
MKKIILSSLLVLAFGFTYAQKAEFGIKGGLNVANQNYSGDGAPSPSSIIGFHIGGFVDVKISDKFSIQPELLYSTQGSKFNLDVPYDGQDYSTENTFKLAYINIPVMFKYYAAAKFSLEAGPQIGFLVDSKLKTNVIGQSVSQDAKDIFESIDFGLNLGAGYDFTKKLSVGIRYNLGLTNVMKTESGDNSEVKNSVFSLSVGYKF